MRDVPHRIILLALMLVGVWIVTYWLWPGGTQGDREPPITFSDAPPALANDDSEPALDKGLGVSETLEVVPDAAHGAGDSVDVIEAGDDPDLALLPPEFDDYVVKKGDDLMSLADRIYGDERLWHAIAKANKSIDPKRLRVGTTLRIPRNPANIEGVIVDARTAEPVEEPTLPAPAPIEYTVEPGDMLSGIAKQFYGKHTAWTVIFEANRHTIDAPEDIRPGMKLVIPPPQSLPAELRAGVGEGRADG